MTSTDALIARDPELASVLFAVQEARLTLGSVAALLTGDVSIGGGCVFLSLDELAASLPYLVQYAAAEVGLLFDSSGTHVLRFLKGRTGSAEFTAKRESLEREWTRVKIPVLSIRNNLSHHSPYSVAGFEHGVASMGRVTYAELLAVVALASYCVALLNDDSEPAAIDDFLQAYNRLRSGLSEYEWPLNAIRHQLRLSTTTALALFARYPWGWAMLSFRKWADGHKRRRGDVVDWGDGAHRDSALIAAHGINSCAALSHLYFALLMREVRCGPGHMLAGPFMRAKARTRILKLFYASVVRLFEDGRVNLMSTAAGNWAPLPAAAKTLFRTFIWPLWRARAAELKRFRDTGAYHFAREGDDRDDSWTRFQARVDYNTVQVFAYTAYAFGIYADLADLGMGLLRPHPTFAPSSAFDPRDSMSVYGRILRRKFVESEDFKLILANQPTSQGDSFPS